jgi:tetratricopeptide (TPR) repeat protein
MLLVLTALLLAAPCAATADEKADKVAALIKRADDLYAKRRSDKVTWQAIGFLREAIKLDSNNFEALWRLGRAFFWLADNTTDEARDRSLGDKGYRYALDAAKLQPKRVEGHFWAAVTLGEYSKGVGIITALRQGLEKKFLDSLKRAARINRRYAGGGADRAFAMYHHNLPWPKKDNKEALKHLERSLKINRRSTRTHYYFAKVLADEDRKEEARKHLKRCLALNPRSWDAYDNYRYQYKCRKLAKSL